VDHQQLQQTVSQTIVSPPQPSDPLLVTTLTEPRKRLAIRRRQSHITPCLVARLATRTKDELRQQT